MANIKDFNKAYSELMKADNKFSRDRSLKMEINSWGKNTYLYFTAYIAGNSLTNNVGLVSDSFPTPIHAVKDVIRKIKKLIKEVQQNDITN